MSLEFASSPPTTHKIQNYHKIINLVPVNYQKPPSYCRSICAGRNMKRSSKAKHMHERKDGFKKRKKILKRSDKDLLLLSNYRNKNIPTGTRHFEIFSFCFLPFFITTILSFMNLEKSFDVTKLSLLQIRYIATFVIRSSRDWSKSTTSVTCSAFTW